MCQAEWSRVYRVKDLWSRRDKAGVRTDTEVSQGRHKKGRGATEEFTAHTASLRVTRDRALGLPGPDCLLPKDVAVRGPLSVSSACSLDLGRLTTFSANDLMPT